MEHVPSILDVAETEKWIDDLGYRCIRTSDCVQRLKRICMLGTMQYVTELRHNYSRYEHSLGVAKLAHEYATHWRLRDEMRKKAVLGALLHDIGHLPFSHASEVFFRGVWGRYHAAHSVRLSRHLAKVLYLGGATREAEDVLNAIDLIKEHETGKVSAEGVLLHHIFHGPLSADTLDGITRAAESVGLGLPRPLELIHGTSLDGPHVIIPPEGRKHVEYFFDLKTAIYQDYIYCSRGLAAEAMLTRALELAFEGMTDASEFLSLDDDDTIERLRGKTMSGRILERLESRDLFCSLRDVNEDKYNLVVDVYGRLCSRTRKPLFLLRALERSFAKQMQLEDASLFILHPIIRLDLQRNSG